MGNGQHLLPLTIGHCHGVCCGCGGTVTTTGVSTSFLHFRFLVLFRVLLVFTLTNGLYQSSLQLTFQSIVFWILHVQREPFVLSTHRSPETYARDEAGMVVLDSRVSHLQFFLISLLFQAGIYVRHTKEQEKYRSFMFYVNIFQRFWTFVLYNNTLQLHGKNGQNKPENPQN